MTNKEAVNWIINLMADIGKAEHSELWRYEQALKEIKEMLESEFCWTPVSEGLPDTYTAVLVSDGKYVWVDSLEDDFDGNGNYGVWWDSSNLVDFDKTAWMPLPEPFEGGDAERVILPGSFEGGDAE